MNHPPVRLERVPFRRTITPVEGEGFEVSMRVDWVIPAVSQSADKTITGGQLTVNEDCSTSMNRVFATGDYVTGPSNIIGAIGAAHKTARSVDKFLLGLDRFETKVETKEWPQIPFGSYKG